MYVACLRDFNFLDSEICLPRSWSCDHVARDFRALPQVDHFTQVLHPPHSFIRTRLSEPGASSVEHGLDSDSWIRYMRL
jgi:hypothetical protein